MNPNKKINVNGASIDELYLVELIKEARDVIWSKKKKNESKAKNDHHHCNICQITLLIKKELFYDSDVGWLCKFCYNNFFESDLESISEKFNVNFL